MWSLCLLIFTLLFCTSQFTNGAVNVIDIDPAKTIAWGAGLNPVNITLRARYIFVQLVYKNGKNVTESPGKKVISSHIDGETQKGTPCPLVSQILDCNDGSFIVRYKISKTCFNLQIVLTIKNEKLTLQHSKFKGPIYEEECYCPSSSIELWLHNNECQKNYSQILRDLELFPNVNFDEIRNKIIKKYDKPNSVSICHYVIKSNKIYRKCYGKHIGFKEFIDVILLSLTRKTVLPDVEFFTNLGDWPLVPNNQELYPMFSWCGSTDTNDIILPTYDITKASLESMGGVMLDMLSVQRNIELPWNKKIEKVFWRGRDSSIARLNLIDIAKKNPDLFNASITNFFFFRDKIDEYGPEQKYIPFFDFFKYKYQLNIDGTVAAYRFPYLLAGNSLVFKQSSKYHEFFYHDLEAGKHFISIKSDLSDLVEKVKWALENDSEAYKITRKARQYTRDNLMPQNIFCYHVALIYEWSKRLTNSVKIFPEMELVSQPNYNCECIHERKKDEL